MSFGRKRKLRKAFVVGAFLFFVIVAIVTVTGWRAFGHAASGARAERMHRSPQWHAGAFRNPNPMFNDPHAVTALFSASEVASPRASAPVPVASSSGEVLQKPPSSGLRVTWFGHSSTLLEIDGKRILTDPAFGQRASPFSWVGPERWYAPPISLDDIAQGGPIDAVVISHDHHDHLQHSSIEQLKALNPIFIVPLGVGAHLEYWGVPADNIRELDWWESTTLGDLVVNCTPSRHASGRHLFDQGATLWASWSFVGEHRVFFSGDTGLFAGMGEIGERFGPFDLTMIEVGQYHPTWPDWHIGPEQAVKAAKLLGSKVFLPIHWSLWQLAAHGWTEPGERARAAAIAEDVPFVLPKPGESIEPTTALASSQAAFSASSEQEAPAPWWPNEPWVTGSDDPIVSTVAGDPAVRMP